MTATAVLVILAAATLGPGLLPAGPSDPGAGGTPVISVAGGEAVAADRAGLRRPARPGVADLHPGQRRPAAAAHQPDRRGRRGRAVVPAGGSRRAARPRGGAGQLAGRAGAALAGRHPARRGQCRERRDPAGTGPAYRRGESLRRDERRRDAAGLVAGRHQDRVRGAPDQRGHERPPGGDAEASGSASTCTAPRRCWSWPPASPARSRTCPGPPSHRTAAGSPRRSTRTSQDPDRRAVRMSTSPTAVAARDAGRLRGTARRAGGLVTGRRR